MWRPYKRRIYHQAGSSCRSVPNLQRTTKTERASDFQRMQSPDGLVIMHVTAGPSSALIHSAQHGHRSASHEHVGVLIDGPFSVWRSHAFGTAPHALRHAAFFSEAVCFANREIITPRGLCAGVASTTTVTTFAEISQRRFQLGVGVGKREEGEGRWGAIKNC